MDGSRLSVEDQILSIGQANLEEIQILEPAACTMLLMRGDVRCARTY